MNAASNWRGIIPVGTIAIFGALLSVAAFLIVGDWERQGTKTEFERAANLRIAALQHNIAMNLEILHSLKSFFLSTEQISRSNFHRFVAHNLAQHKQIQALEWIPRVPAKTRAAYEKAARREGFSHFQFTERFAQGEMVPAAEREEYFPVYYVEPLAGNEKAVGFDLGSEPTRLETLGKARDSGEIVVSGRITLVQETEDRFGILVFLAVYRENLGANTAAARRENLLGFVLGVFRIADIVEQSLAPFQAAGPDFDIVVLDRSAPPGKQLLFSSRPGMEAGASELEASGVTGAMKVGGRDWEILVDRSQSLPQAEVVWEPWAVLVLGLLFSALLSAYVHAILGQRARIEQTVDERTAELARALAELFDVNTTLRDSQARSEAVLFNAVDGIITIDEQGMIESFNPAAERTFGYAAHEVTNRNVSLLMPSPYQKEHDSYLAAYLRTGEKKIIGIGRQVTGLRKNGEQFPMDLSVAEINLGGKRLFTGIVRDLTERVKAEQALQESEGAFNRLREEQALSELQATWNARIEAYRDFVHTVGNLITPARVRASSLANSTLTLDYLRQLRARAELLLEKLNKGELLSYLAGEGKRDLPQFMRGLDILAETTREKEKDLHAIENSLVRVIETTTAQSHLQRVIAVATEVSLVKTIDGVIQLLEENWKKKGISRTFSASNAEGAPVGEVLVRVDKIRLFNMIHNILKNAGEAFAGFAGEDRKIAITLQEESDRVVLKVSDNGRGLGEDELAQVGRIGFTTKKVSRTGEGGSGMGIHNCRIFMAGIGGRFEINSAGPGKGASATAIFPAQGKA